MLLQNIGGSEYALAFGKNEMPGYHTRSCKHISDISVEPGTGHLDNAGYSIVHRNLMKNFQKIRREICRYELTLLKSISPEASVKSCGPVSSLGGLFYTPEII